MPVFPPLLPKKVQRIDLNVVGVRSQVLSKGLRLRWEMAGQCPCGSPVDRAGRSGLTGEPRTGCEACGGTGIIYHSAQDIVGQVVGAHQDPRRSAVFGEYAWQAVTVTLLPEHLPSFLDRLTVLDQVMVWREKRRREAAVEPLRVPIVRRNMLLGAVQDQTSPVVETHGVLYARRANADGLVEGGELVEGADFDVTSGGEIDWSRGDAAGTAPPVGGYYGVSYFGHPRYLVSSSPHVTRATWLAEKRADRKLAELPVTVEAKLEWFGGGGAA